jgi:hypothetical protein
MITHAGNSIFVFRLYDLKNLSIIKLSKIQTLKVLPLGTVARRDGIRKNL